MATALETVLEHLSLVLPSQLNNPEGQVCACPPQAEPLPLAQLACVELQPHFRLQMLSFVLWLGDSQPTRPVGGLGALRPTEAGRASGLERPQASEGTSGRGVM